MPVWWGDRILSLGAFWWVLGFYYPSMLSHIFSSAPLADKGHLDGAKLTGQNMTVNVLWADMPADLATRLPQTPGG